MKCIFSVFNVDLIRESHSGRVLFLSVVTAGSDRGLWREYIRVSCIVVLRSSRHLTLHVNTGSSTESFVLFNPSTISQSPPRLFCVMSEQAIFLSLMCSDTVFVGCRHHSYRPLLHKHVDKWSFVSVVAGDIYSVTKQLLELAPWACFPFRLVISCLHASGPWAASPPMTGSSMKELIYNCN